MQIYAVMIGGGALIATWLPLLIWGAQKEPASVDTSSTPTLVLDPTGAGVRWHF